MRIVLPILLCILAATPARADVSIEFCSKSREASRSPPSWPTALARLEIKAKHNLETVTRAPSYLLEEVSNLNEQNRRATADNVLQGYRYKKHFVGDVLAREESHEGGREERHPTVLDGRYVVLITESRQAPTPAYREHHRDCSGTDWAGHIYSRIGDTLAYQKCVGDCSEIEDQVLIQKAFGPPRTRSVTLDTGNLTMSISGTSRGVPGSATTGTRGSSFTLLSRHLLDLDEVGSSRAGLMGSVFHPEKFSATAIIRESTDMRTGDLIVAIKSLQACPYGDFAMTCAPREMESRYLRVHGPPKDTCFGTSNCGPEGRARTKYTNADIRKGGLLGIIVSLCMIGACLLYASRWSSARSWYATMGIGIVLGLTSMGVLTLLSIGRLR